MEDLSGRKFGKLIVLYFSHRKGSNYYWNCRCECGNEKPVIAGKLRSGETKSCGCLKRNNLIGKKFDRLTVVELSHYDNKGNAYYACKCNCGNEILKIARGSHLGKETKSCGCMQKENNYNVRFLSRKRIDITGNKYGRLLVLEYSHSDSENRSKWKCICDCGTPIIVDGDKLKIGHTQSCGCLNDETRRSRVGENHPLYDFSMSDEERFERRRDTEYRSWRKEILKRDNYECQCCGKDDGAMCSHHIYNYKDYKHMRTEINNGITLCEECHLEFHSIYKRRYNNLNQLVEYFNGKKVEIPLWLKNVTLYLEMNSVQGETGLKTT